jgi:hypothetical protein
MGKKREGRKNISERLKSLYHEHISLFNEIWESEKGDDAIVYYEINGIPWFPIVVDGKSEMIGLEGIEAVLLPRAANFPFAIQFSGETEEFLATFEDSEIGQSLSERGITYTVRDNIMFIDCYSVAWILQGDVIYDKALNSYFSKDRTRLIRVAKGDSPKSFSDSAVLNYDIPEGVTSIGYFAFKDRKFSAVNLPNSVENIETGAFANNAILTSITIPEGVLVIGSVAFSYCSKLNSINVANGNRHYKATDGNLYSKEGCSLIQYAIGKKSTQFTVPDDVKYIDDYAFAGSDNLTEITIMPSKESVFIESSAFSNCEKLTTIKLPDNVVYLGDHAFDLCVGLKEISIPNRIRGINGYTFNGCENLTLVNLSDEISIIGDCAFKGCEKLSQITIPSSVWHIGVGAFEGCIALKRIYFKGTASQWKEVLIYDAGKEFEQAKVHYYSEKEPSGKKSNYWRYVDGVETIWN